METHGVGCRVYWLGALAQGRDFSGQIEKFASKRGYIPSIETPTGISNHPIVSPSSPPSFRLPLLSMQFNPTTVYFAATTACTPLMHFSTTGNDRCERDPPFFTPLFLTVDSPPDSINHMVELHFYEWNFSYTNFNRTLIGPRESSNGVLFFERSCWVISETREAKEEKRGIRIRWETEDRFEYMFNRMNRSIKWIVRELDGSIYRLWTIWLYANEFV